MLLTISIIIYSSYILQHGQAFTSFEIGYLIQKRVFDNYVAQHVAAEGNVARQKLEALINCATSGIFEYFDNF